MKSFAVLVSLSVAVCCVWVSQAQGKKNIHLLNDFLKKLVLLDFENHSTKL